MAIIDKSKTNFIEDRNERVSIGIDMPFRKSPGNEGYFETTKDTISAVKNNIKNLLLTNVGERIMQPDLGMNLRSYLFQPYTEELELSITDEILSRFKTWLPFVNVVDLQVNMNNLDDDVGKNRLNIKVDFNIIQDPNTLESIQIEIS